MTDLSDFLTEQKDKQAVEELCHRYGAAFVIEAARAWVIAKERAASEEHRRWRDEMMRADKATGATA
jgi:hypothetical protein